MRAKCQSLGASIMNVVNSVAVIAALSLIILFANESLAVGKRYGSIGFGAEVDPDADMDYHSIVGRYSLVANAHLYRYAEIGEHVNIEEGVSVHRKSVVMNHTRIMSGAIIGNRTVCEPYSVVGQNVTISDYACLGGESTVMSHGKVGRHAVVGYSVTIGRGAILEKYACVASNAKVGTGAHLGPYTIVQVSVQVPPGLHVTANTIVINAPVTKVVYERIHGRPYSTGFHRAVDKLAARSDSGFIQYFSKRLSAILNDLYEECETEFEMDVLYLLSSYLQKMHGRSISVMGSRTTGDAMLLQPWLFYADDCQNARQYDKFFDVKTKENLLIIMAILNDLNRPSRIKGEKFWSIVKDLLNKKRKVLVLNPKCGRTTTVECNDCGKGDGLQKMEKKFMQKIDINQK